MSTHDTLDYVLQRDIIDGLIPKIGREAWQTVYRIEDNESQRFAIYSALLEPKMVKKALEKDDWDLRIGDGLPGFSQSWTGCHWVTKYHRFGSNEGIRPLIIVRDFHGAWDSYTEVCEEFRHFHNLAEDKNHGSLLDFDESGHKIEVALFTKHSVKVNWLYLRRFLAATQLHLAIYFESIRYSPVDFDSIPEEKQLIEFQDTTSKYSFRVHRCDFDKEKYSCFSRLRVKTREII